MDSKELLQDLSEYIVYNLEERNMLKYRLRALVKYCYNDNIEEFINKEVKNVDYGTFIDDIKELYNEKIDFLPIYDEIENLFNGDYERAILDFDE